MNLIPRLLTAPIQAREALARYIPFALGAPLEIDAVTSAVKCFPDLPAPQPVDSPPQGPPAATRRGPRPKGKACRPYLGAAEIRPKGYDASRQYVPRLPACSYENIRLACERLGIHYTTTYQAYYRQVATSACRKYQVGWVDWPTMQGWLLQAFPEPVSPATQQTRRRVLLRAGLLELRRAGGRKRGTILQARLPGVAQLNRPPAGWDAARDEVRRKDAERQRRFYAAKKAKQAAASNSKKLRNTKRHNPNKTADTGRKAQTDEFSRPHRGAESEALRQGEAAPGLKKADGEDRDSFGGGQGGPPAIAPSPPAPQPLPQSSAGEATATILRARLRARELGEDHHGAIIAQLGDAIWQLVLSLTGGPCLEMLATYIPEALDIALADLAHDIDQAGLRLPGSLEPPGAIASAAAMGPRQPYPPNFKNGAGRSLADKPAKKRHLGRYEGMEKIVWNMAYATFGRESVNARASTVNAIARMGLAEEHLAQLAREAKESGRSPAGSVCNWYAKAKAQSRLRENLQPDALTGAI